MGFIDFIFNKKIDKELNEQLNKELNILEGVSDTLKEDKKWLGDKYKNISEEVEASFKKTYGEIHKREQEVEVLKQKIECLKRK